jgi:Protein of unknown function (DUF1654)
MYSKLEGIMAVLQEEGRQGHQILTGVDRLGLRISTMLTAPQAQLDRRLTVHKLDSDDDYAWNTILELIEESEGVTLDRNEDGSVTVSWEKPSEADIEVEEDELVVVVEDLATV